MASGARAGVGPATIVAILVGATMLTAAPRATAATPAWVKQAFGVIHGGKGRGGRAVGATPERYVTDDGRVFVLDHDGGLTLIKFEDDPEVWALQPTHGPRGDMIFKNDIDETMLRETQLGGVTVFTPRRPDGSAAAPSGPSAPIRVAYLGPMVLYQRLFQASVRISRLAQHVISVEAPDADAASDGLIADAAFVVTEGAAQVVRRPGGRAHLARLGKVMIGQGEQPAATLRSGVLLVTVSVSRGLAGRPSSERLARVMLRGR